MIPGRHRAFRSTPPPIRTVRAQPSGSGVPLQSLTRVNGLNTPAKKKFFAPKLFQIRNNCYLKQMRYGIKPSFLFHIFVPLSATLFSLATLLTSCEGYSCGEGVIYDKITEQPIDSVLCKVLTGSETQHSDSLGRYEVCNPFGGCVPDCPDIVVEFSKPGYRTTKVKNPKDIYLDR